MKHDIFVIERQYKATPARAFAFWSSPDAKARWFVGPDEWTKTKLESEFRIGGRETISGGPKGGTVHGYRALYHDIVPDQRIVLSYEMYMDDTRTSVSLVTVTFEPDGKGVKLVYTEQGVYLDGHDAPSERVRGTEGLLDQLGRVLEQASGTKE